MECGHKSEKYSMQQLRSSEAAVVLGSPGDDYMMNRSVRDAKTECQNIPTLPVQPV
jgi:hypothetical protein